MLQIIALKNNRVKINMLKIPLKCAKNINVKKREKERVLKNNTILKIIKT